MKPRATMASANHFLLSRCVESFPEAAEPTTRAIFLGRVRRLVVFVPARRARNSFSRVRRVETAVPCQPPSLESMSDGAECSVRFAALKGENWRNLGGARNSLLSLGEDRAKFFLHDVFHRLSIDGGELAAQSTRVEARVRKSHVFMHLPMRAKKASAVLLFTCHCATDESTRCGEAQRGNSPAHTSAVPADSLHPPRAS